MSDRRSDGERAELLVECVEGLREQSGRHVAVRDTPMGVKMGVGAGQAGELGWAQTETDARALIDEYEDILVSVYEGDLEVVDDVSNEEWPHFVELVEETEGLDVAEEELQAARGE